MQKKSIYLFLFLILFVSCHKEKEIPIIVDFNYEVELQAFPDHHAAAVKFVNATTGAYKYAWTFEGGMPATSDKQHPGIITYTQNGTFKITLEAWNHLGKYSSKTIDLEVDTTLYVSFDLEVLIDNSSPAEVQIHNKSVGAIQYLWSFENGNPAQSTERYPQNVIFSSVGTHTVSLVVSDGKRELSMQKSIEVSPPLAIDFDIEIPFNDLELPLTATLINKSTCYNTLFWTSDMGSVVDNQTAGTTSIRFANSGTNSITLKAMSSKDTLTLTKMLEIKPDRNLLALTDVKLGIITAGDAVSCYYSTKLRRNITLAEAQQNNGNDIDIVYFGHSRLFAFNKFLSPDSAVSYFLPPINNPMKIWIVNDPIAAGFNFSAADFANLDNAQDLQAYDIKTMSNWNHFGLESLPYFVFYQTQDGRKGVVKIKQIVDNGINSYIVADVKVMKHP